mgnify:CR=1 FL=1
MCIRDRSNPTNDITVSAPKVTYGFERSVQVRPYESAKASIFVQTDVKLEDDGSVALGSYQEAAKRAAYEAKTAVYDSLKISYEVLDGWVLEQLDKVLGPVEVLHDTNTTPARPKPVGKGSSWGDNPPSDKEGLIDELIAHRERFFDNREDKRNPKAPDFKRKISGEGIWTDKLDSDTLARIG